VICIRYKDFSAGTHDATGLHGRAERGPHGVTVYLVPGLTACQRRAVIRRLRQEASRYVGPALPLPQLAVALGLDRVRSAARVTGAVVRLHPAVTLLPGALVAVLMTLFVIASADGPGLTAGPPPVLADAAAFGPGMPQQVSEAVVPARRSAPSRTGLVTGHPTLIAQSRARRWNRPVFLYRRPGARCGCPAVLIGPRPAWFSGQPACGRSPSTLAPDTAHLPDPRAFAT
jgi:hypothetical protein